MGGYIWCIRNGVVDSRFTYTSTAQATADGLGWNNLFASTNDGKEFSPISNMKYNGKEIVGKYKKCYVKFKLYSTSYYATSRNSLAFKYRQTGSDNDFWANGNLRFTPLVWYEGEAEFNTQNMAIANNGFIHYMWNESRSIQYRFYITGLKFYN